MQVLCVIEEDDRPAGPRAGIHGHHACFSASASASAPNSCCRRCTTSQCAGGVTVSQRGSGSDRGHHACMAGPRAAEIAPIERDRTDNACCHRGDRVCIYCMIKNSRGRTEAMI